MNKIIFIVVVTILAADIYVEMAHLGSYPYYWHLLWWIPAVAAIIGILISKLWHIVGGRYFAKGVLLAVELPKVPFAICVALGTILSPVVPGTSFFWNGIGALFGLSPAMADCSEWCGVFRQGSQVLYVSQGTGTKFRFRLGTNAEITLITLHSISPEKVSK